ncbi:hypothetical protein [Ferroglobus sp.]|uniref:hypothetical protein n=1 Tax=Ferroglobus sp. TaxID=2614230 RepID=UPI0025BBE629|nr:hypothetical protein [Ferroglobus sp.]
MVLRKLLGEAEIVVRHLIVLEAVMKNQPIGIFKLSELLNMPKHKVRYSLRTLEHAGIIEPTPHGAVIREGGEEQIKKLKDDYKSLMDYMKKIGEMIEKITE